MGHQDSKDVPAITWRFLSILSILVPARHYLILSPKLSALLAGYRYFISPCHQKKETQIRFDQVSHGSSGSLCRWFSSFSFLVSACGSVRHGSLVNTGNTKPPNWCIPCAYRVHTARIPRPYCIIYSCKCEEPAVDKLNQLCHVESLTRLHPWPVLHQSALELKLYGKAYWKDHI